MNDSAPPVIPSSPAEEPPTVAQGWLRGLLFLLAYIVLSSVVGIVVFLALGIGSEFEINFAMVSTTGLLIQFSTLAVTVLLVWLFRFGLDRRSMGSLGFHFGSQEKRDLLTGMLLGIGLIGFIFLILWSSGQIVVGALSFPIEAICLQVALGVMVAFGEEISMRGYLLNNLLQSAHRYLALVLVSVVFVAFHAANPNLSWVALINIFLAGLLLGIYYVHRRSLWFPIGLHFTWNLFQGAVFGSPVSGLEFEGIFSFEPVGNDLVTGGEFGLEASLLTTAVMVLAILAIHLKYRTCDSCSEAKAVVQETTLPPSATE
ncbi:MAG: CPBP family intramembrane metalloprotease [bacterium]|nr:CPBP family intramembrane metalloprotease [bacterium]